MNFLLTASFFNSVGMFSMWLMLGPFYSAALGGIAAFGLLGMARQVSGVLGTLVSGSIADEGWVLKKLLFSECIILLLCSLFFVVFVISEHVGIAIVPYWVSIRYFFGSLSFVFFFKVLASAQNQSGSSSIVQLMVTQGATIIAPVFATTIPLLFEHFFIVALVFDIFTSLVFCVAVLVNFGGSLDVGFEKADKRKTIWEEIKSTILVIHSKKYFPWNWIQIVMLIFLTGYFVLALDISNAQKFIDSKVFFPMITVFYGIALWVSGFWAKKIRNIVLYFQINVLLLIFSGILLLLENIEIKILSFILYAWAFWGCLHSSNKALLDRSNSKEVGRLRASMVFYLAVIFGLGELVFGILFDKGLGYNVLFVMRLILGCVLLVAVSRQSAKYS